MRAEERQGKLQLWQKPFEWLSKGTQRPCWAGCHWMAAGSSLGHLWLWLSWENPWLCPTSSLCARSQCWGGGGAVVAAAQWWWRGGHPRCPCLGCSGGSHPLHPGRGCQDGGRLCEVWPRGLIMPPRAAVPGGKFPILPDSQKSGGFSPGSAVSAHASFLPQPTNLALGS